MSTTDPAAALRAKAAAQQGSARALVLTIVWAALLLAVGVVAGYALGSVLGTIRDMTVNSVFSDTPDPEYPWWAMPVAVTGSIVTLGMYSKWNHRFAGRASEFVGVGPVSIWLVGAAAGLWWTTATQWAPVDRVGTTVDPAFGRDEVWGIGGWIWYAAAWWIPALVTALALVALIGGTVARRGQGGRRGRLEQLLRAGRRVDGIVTAVSGSTAHDASFTLLRWTFTFTDLQGQQRWVDRTEGFGDGTGPVLGATVVVVFDPTRPSDRKRIFAATNAGAVPEDFLRPGTQ
ncbi:hypothetical protein EDF31_11025 [Curtobacterium sp. PhB142]|uniref:hypothetical protein n=1 Tax=unclassified Curtobacterium TaxID=257496 RepID=UPI000F4A4EFB|nr:MULTISPECIES: hypothetical protein [unclassified Curtobacterium]ROS36237.1 hypothetical protein EDF53_2204 [Curtobacterium sp. PhB78]TCL81923.1 hypothetical protein EDF31_11025 [Curtobacterium sp. PhB142]TCL99983.1 hypothetical protein EDF26_11164 [Curtobacterium sp. PhB134]